MLVSGTISGEDLAWHAALPNWQPLATVLGGGAAAGAAAAAAFTPTAASQTADLPVAGGFPAAGGTILPPPAGAGFGMPGAMALGAAGELAGLGARFLGALVDGVVALVLAAPGMIMMSSKVFGAASANPNDPEAIQAAIRGGGAGLLFALLGSAIFYLIQGYLLARSSQSVGKIVAGTRVVMADGSRADLLHSFVLRTLLPGLIIGYSRNLPLIGGLLGVLSSLYVLVDVLFIFRADRRCVHDLIAGTKVVRA